VKTKCHAIGAFVITGFRELGHGRLEALHVGGETESWSNPAGQVRAGFAGKGLWGYSTRSGLAPPVEMASSPSRPGCEPK
jgi:hypothetical protein